MKDIKTIHQHAMDLVKKAKDALTLGDKEVYAKYSEEAFILEKDAANELIAEFDSEPTRSVLFRSAATLAFNLGKYKEAGQLIHQALSGNPYTEIEDELNKLLQQVNSKLMPAVIRKISPEFSNEIILNQDFSEGRFTQYTFLPNESQEDYEFENAYIELLREKAANLKIESKDKKYSKAIVVNYIIEFLNNVQNSYRNFSEVNFKKNFEYTTFHNYEKFLNNFKKNSQTLAVDFKFSSFGVSIAADTSLMNYSDLPDKKLKDFTNSLFENFKNEVLLSDYNDEVFQAEILKKYSVAERDQIFSSMLNSLKEQCSYNVSIVNRGFGKVIKRCPAVNKTTEEIIVPKQKVLQSLDDSSFLRKTFDLTDSSGKKKANILSEHLSYAEFNVSLTNLDSSTKSAYFINPYEVKIIFDHGKFIIDDNNYQIYVSHKDFKTVQKLYSNELIQNYNMLLQNTISNENERLLLEKMKSTIMISL